MQLFFALFLSNVFSHNFENGHIVKLKRHTPIQAHLNQVKALFKTRSDSDEIRQVYTSIGNMYSARFSQEVLVKVAGMGDVEYIQNDTWFSINTVQHNSTWGLAPISHGEKPTLQVSSFAYNYTFDGSGTTVYVLDTGVMIAHPEFEGRARFGARFAGDNDEDEHGHGKHCAGTIASKTYGVAKKANIVAVRVLNAKGDGWASSIISGLDWMLKDAGGRYGNVVNLSFESRNDRAVDDAVEAVAINDIIVVVAAGNENKVACKFSPASSPYVITVGATDFSDSRAEFSNYGRCVDVFALGDEITSTRNNGRTETLSRTSMAAPFVSGLAAYFLSEKFEPNVVIRHQIIRDASKGRLANMATVVSSTPLNSTPWYLTLCRVPGS
ncbi:proteinase B [Entomophthora muscae]|uniref:Proteinase B n=1 Tax=Entomophthora muscae TaxID=34485 RepID=A0ACC2UR40_9FUNG|nr:proteinase B [Entomophthora muscae]